MSIAKLIKESRINTWWNHLIAPLTIGLYIQFVYQEEVDYRLYFTFLIASAFLALLGYLINDFFDVEMDAKVNKPNFFSAIDRKKGCIIIVATLLMVFYAWYLVPKDGPYVYFILALEIILFLLYSAPFPRWKEKRWLGIIADTLYGHVLPWVMIIILCPAFQRRWYLLALVLVWQIFVGARNIVTHQLEDRAKDITAGMTTLGTSVSSDKLRVWIKLCAILEAITLTCILYFSANYIIYTLIASIVVTALYEYRLYSNTKKITPHFGFLNNLYEYILPLALLIAMMIQNETYYFIFIHLLLFSKGVFMFQQFLPRTTINYLIYYFFKIFGVDLKKENTSAIDYLKKKWGK